MTVLLLRGLGAFEVRLSTTTVTAFPTDKIRALLVYLTLEKKSAHRREMLAALFWPAIDSSLALNNLRVTLHRLRETLDKVQPGLGSALIESTRQTVQLNSTLISTDVDTFQTLLTACATHAHADLHQCVECRIRLAEAAARYQGELLTGFGLADAPTFEEWLLFRRESLHQQALTALHTLVQSFEEHTVYLALAIHPAGRLLAAAGADGRLLASASQAETVRLWEVSSGACLQTLRTPGPYAGMNITGVTGISAAQKAALKVLGAVEE